MQVTHPPDTLRAFERDIAERFLRREILSPVHLSGGNEADLIRIFEEHVDEADYVLCSWRSHAHCLLKGVPATEVRDAIIAGKSIALCFQQYRILSSGIAGGIAPIAVGLGMAIKRKGESRKVVCFLGDMSARMGIVRESIEYARNHKLPCEFFIEDNGLSVTTRTDDAWGEDAFNHLGDYAHVHRYRYVNSWPHVGVGRHVAF